MEKEDIILRTDRVSKFFGGLAAVNGVSINVGRNSITLIIVLMVVEKLH
jgi:ABC-type branched-subunit amino acid transport system ATPase component